MIFISVVPDSFYFLWQVELQLHNFTRFGIGKEDIHVLIGCDKEYGVSMWFREFIENNADKASFYVYPKTLENYTYIPAVRPHLLHQHFARFPELSKEVIFYHDSDIVFRELPDFETLCAGDEWYLADCRSYMDSVYLRKNGDENFLGMCTVMGIDPALVVANDHAAGGAQSVLKGIDAAFWKLIETGCEELYRYLNRNATAADAAATTALCGAGDHQTGIQSWCTDMWVLFWTGLKMNKTIRLSAELDFSWAGDPIEKYSAFKIFHNSGVTSRYNIENHMVFNKTAFNTHSPYYFRHDVYNKNYCGSEYVKLISEFESTGVKEDLSDVTFLIPLYIDSDDRLVNLEIISRYLHKHFNTHIIIAEAGLTPKIKDWMLPPNAAYHFIEDSNPYFHRTKYNNFLIAQSKTRYIALYDTDVILPPSQIMESVEVLRKGDFYITYPYTGFFYSTNDLVKDIFRMTLDPALFEKFAETHALGSKRSFGGCVFLDKATFIANGGENEHLTSWGPDDIERAARYKILGYKIHRAAGGLYHLPHERGVNSNYQEDTYAKLMLEYLDVCSRSREELLAYIQTWDYFKN